MSIGMVGMAMRGLGIDPEKIIREVLESEEGKEWLAKASAFLQAMTALREEQERQHELLRSMQKILNDTYLLVGDLQTAVGSPDGDTFDAMDGSQLLLTHEKENL